MTNPWEQTLKQHLANKQTHLSPLCVLPQIGILAITGNDAKTFLQGQMTNDVSLLTSENPLFTAFCTPKGRVIALGHLLQNQEGYLFVSQKKMIAILQAHLQKYALFSKVTLSDPSDHWHILGFTLNQPPSSLITAPMLVLAQQPTLSLCLIHKDSEQPHLQALAKHYYYAESRFWRLAHLQQMLPIVTTATSGMFTPHDLGMHLLQGISFNKGCYVGQEIIARMQHLGKCKKQCYLIRLPATANPQSGMRICPQGSDSAVGHVIDWCQQQDHIVALAVINSSEHHTHLTLENGATIDWCS